MERENEAGPEIRTQWRALRRGSTKVAFSLKELVSLTSDFSLKWAQNCDSRVIRTDPAKHLLVYRVTCHKKDSDPNGHVVRIKFDFNRMKQTGTVDDLDCRVTCSCPAFLYWGPQWNLGAGDTLYGAPRPKFQPPTDPKRYQFVICKHIKIVSDRIAPVLERMLAKHRNKKDRAQQEQNLQDIELEKQRTQQTVEELQQDTKPVPDTTPQNPNAPEVEPPVQHGPVKTWGPSDDELGDLTLPGQEPMPSKPEAPAPVPEPAVPEPAPEAPQPAPAPEPTPEAPAPAPKPPKAPGAPRKPKVEPGAKGDLVLKDKGRQVTPNLTVYDEDEEAPVVLPGAKGKLVKDERSNVTLHDEDTTTTKLPGKRPGKVVRDRDTSGRRLPPNITVHDDDDDETVRINSSLRRALAGLIIPGAEPESATIPPGRLGSLLIATCSATSGSTS